MSDAKHEAHGLEVVAWQDAENPLYTTGEKRQMHGWATDGYPIVELVRLSDATAVIDQLKADNEALHKQLDEANSAYARLADGVPAAMAKYHKCKKQLDEALGLLEGYRWKDIEINNFVENADETSRIPQQVEERVLQG